MREGAEDSIVIPGHDGRQPTQDSNIDPETREPKDQPLTYLDLTFNTDIPVPPQPLSIDPPNLKHLISPYDWSHSYKVTVTGISCISTLFASFAASCYSPGAEQMADEWHVSQEAVLVGITTFTCGFAVGPMFLAPFSEINGRKPVFVATAILFTVCQLCCAICRSFPG